MLCFRLIFILLAAFTISSTNISVIESSPLIQAQPWGHDALLPLLANIASTNNPLYLNGNMFATGTIIGLFLVAILFSALAYFTTRDSRYGHLAWYLVSSVTLVTAIDLRSSLILPSDIAQTLDTVIPSIIAIALFCGICYCYISLKRKASPNIDSRQLKWPRIGLLFLCLTLLILPTDIANVLSIGGIIATLSVVILILSKMTYQRRPNSRYFLLSWILIVPVVSIATLNIFGLAPIKEPTLTLLRLAVCGQALIFCLLIVQSFFADRKRLIDKKNQLTRQLLNLKTESNLERQHEEEQQLHLETLINERTFELNMTLRELQETNNRLQQQSTIDPLTAVKNRKFFDSRYQAELRLSRRQQSPLSILIIDADKFKQVNDNYGHFVGDQVLKVVAQLISGILKRPNDYVCRYGGEEFAVLLPHTDSNGAAKVAEMIREKIANTSINADSHQLEVTVSIGVSTIIVESDNHPEALFCAADKALYKAKSLGRNRVIVDNESITALLTKK